MNNQEYNSLYHSVHKWLDEKEDYELRKNNVFGISPKYYMYLFGIMFIYLFFIQGTDFSKLNKKKNDSPTAKNFVLFEKPNNNSTILLEDSSEIDIQITEETKFYFKVEFNKDGKTYKGYINKENISK